MRERSLHSRRSSSTAVAIAEDEELYPPETPNPSGYNQYPRSTDSSCEPLDVDAGSSKYGDRFTLRKRRAVPRPILEDDINYQTMAVIRESSKDNPIGAFLRFSHLDQSVMAHFTAEDFDYLAQRLIETAKTDAEAVKTVKPQTARAILLVMRSHLRSLPSRKPVLHYTPGTRFRGGRVQIFLSICVIFGTTDLVKEVFNEDFLAQLNQVTNGHSAKRFAIFLASSQNERLLIELFSSPDYPAKPTRFPPKRFTGRVLEAVIQAHLRLHQPYAVSKLFELHADHEIVPTLNSYAHYTQALVELGEFEAVKVLQRERQAADWTDRFRQQLAIMRGQRSLRFDAELVKSALADIENLNTQSATKFLQALILLRLDRGDAIGAQRLLTRFELGSHSSKKVKLPTDNTTLLLAFKIIARQPEKEQLRTWWDYISASPGLTTDAINALLVRALCKMNLVDEAFAMVASAASGSSPSTAWTIPSQPSKLGILTFNILLRGMATKHGVAGYKQVANLMRQADISANEKTLEYVIDFVRHSLEVDPSELAGLLLDLLRRKPDLRATIGHLDSIMDEAIKRAAVSKNSREVTSNASVNTLDSTAGLSPMGKFDDAVWRIIKSLRERGIRSGTRSLANRLRFEAMMGTTINGMHSARIIWNEMVARGYKPSRRHLLALIQGYTSAGSMGEAEQVLDLARLTENSVSRAMLTVLLIGWAKFGDISRAEYAYESIRRLGNSHRDQGLDIVAVTAMIKAFYSSGMFKAAVELIMTDLPAFNNDLDDHAVSVTATALLLFQDYSPALNVIRSKGEKLNFVHRRIVRKIRVRLERKCARRLATPEDRTVLSLANEMLAKNDVVQKRSRETGSTERDEKKLQSHRQHILELIGEASDGDAMEDEGDIATGMRASRRSLEDSRSMNPAMHDAKISSFDDESGKRRTIDAEGSEQEDKVDTMELVEFRDYLPSEILPVAHAAVGRKVSVSAPGHSMVQPVVRSTE